ncbi:MAG: FAD-dependent oxidoreductase [Egibacteraceae bacterium]
MSSVAVDVVVVGGGIQGLVLVRELSAQGYACVLVTRGPLGGAQTLHSHGALISGMGLVTGALAETVDRHTAPYLRRWGVSVETQLPGFLVIPDGMAADLAPAWQSYGYRPERTDPGSLPGFEPGASPYRVPTANIDKRRLVEGLARGLEARVVQGEVVHTEGELHVRTAGGQTLRLRARAVVLAAGCGTKELLDRTFDVEGRLAARITYSKLHILCLRAPAGVLPAFGAVVSPDLLVIGHRQDDGRGAAAASTWYVTPVDPMATPHPRAPDDAVADVEPRVVALAVQGLRRLFPVLRHDDERVQATVFAGYKQDLDGEQLGRACELVDADRNLMVVLPSVLANAVPNAHDCVAVLRERVEPSGQTTDMPGAGGVAVGAPYEDSGLPWQAWGALARAAGR